MIQRILIVATCALAVTGQAQTWEDQGSRWAAAEIRPEARMRVAKAVALYRRTEGRYLAIERQRRGGVPAGVVFSLHGRESSWSFGCHLHEGSPLQHRTAYVPKGRPLRPDPPYTWEQSAEDALYICKRMDRVAWDSQGAALDAIEAYNGLGYRKYHPTVPTPYLWAGTTLYVRGKYVADGRFDPLAVDRQLGCAAILKGMGWVWPTK